MKIMWTDLEEMVEFLKDLHFDLEDLAIEHFSGIKGVLFNYIMGTDKGRVRSRVLKTERGYKETYL